MRTKSLQGLVSLLVTILLLLVIASGHGIDVKRLLAGRVIRKANAAKEKSLQDVLKDLRRQEATAQRERRQEKESKQGERVSKGEKQYEEPKKEEPVLKTWSEMFAWAINSTVANHLRSNETQTVYTAQHERVAKAATTFEGKRDGPLRALPESKIQTASKKPAERRSIKDSKKKARRNFRMPEGMEDTPLSAMVRAVKLINKQFTPASQKVNALLLLEDMCHSVDNGRDLTLRHVGGVSSIVHALSDKNDRVRATASWSLATCSMNNRFVQNASTSLGAVGALVQLASKDSNSIVRSRALLALNAVLEYEDARIQFRRTPSAIEVLRRALDNEEDVRAVRRALNLGELLARTDLGVWKVEMEAYDITQRVERMLVHRNLDVRESAARLQMVLDGATLL